MEDKFLIGRTEWCTLPELGIPAIKANIDTGAKTSALHAFNIRPFRIRGKKHVRFDIHPIRRSDKILRHCEAEVVDERYIMSSNGHKEHRCVILTPLTIADYCWEIELTLSNRDPLTFRMLLGREALLGRVLIDPSLACHQGSLREKKVFALYRRAKE